MTAAPSLIGTSHVATFLPSKDAVASKIKVKKRQPGVKADTSGGLDDSPVLNHVDSPLRSTFPSSRPLHDEPNVIQCKHCRKPMLHDVAYEHIRVCLQKKTEKAQKKKEQKEANRKAREAQQKANRAEETAAARAAADEDDDDESINGEKPAMAKKSAVGGTTGKKRKAEDADGGPNKKKTKKEIEATKPKVVKPKGPVDVEKQCGVLLSNGQMCARSLTCKSHAMGAKRAVPGRSKPYDVLLAAYQKKNQAKQQKAAIDANAPHFDDVADDNGPVDSDEEKDSVMAAIARSRPSPLDQHIFVPVRRRYCYLRVKELLSSAMGGTRSNVFGGAAASSAAGAESTDSETRRPSLNQSAQPKASHVGPGPPSRKVSGVSVGITPAPATAVAS